MATVSSGVGVATGSGATSGCSGKATSVALSGAGPDAISASNASVEITETSVTSNGRGSDWNVPPNSTQPIRPAWPIPDMT